MVWNEEQRTIAKDLVDSALAFGADLAGLAAVDDLKTVRLSACFRK